MPENAEAMVELFESSGALEMSVFHGFEDGNGTKPLRLAMLPRLKPPQTAPPLVVELTMTVADAVLVESWVEVAVKVAVSAEPGGVNVTAVPDATPVELLSDPPEGLTDKLTVLVNEPVPVTVGVQLAVCAVVMVDGVHTSVTAVMVGPAEATLMFAEPEMLV
jgi:hypothetical protein